MRHRQVCHLILNNSRNGACDLLVINFKTLPGSLKRQTVSWAGHLPGRRGWWGAPGAQHGCTATPPGLTSGCRQLCGSTKPTPRHPRLCSAQPKAPKFPWGRAQGAVPRLHLKVTQPRGAKRGRWLSAERARVNLGNSPSAHRLGVMLPLRQRCSEAKPLFCCHPLQETLTEGCSATPCEPPSPNFPAGGVPPKPSPHQPRPCSDPKAKQRP